MKREMTVALVPCCANVYSAVHLRDRSEQPEQVSLVSFPRNQKLSQALQYVAIHPSRPIRAAF